MPQTMPSNLKTAVFKAPAQIKQRIRLNSFGIRLFCMIMSGAVLSIASVAFLFAETIKFQAEEQIEKVLESKVGTINEITDRAENLAYSLGVSVSTLHVRKAETPETYQELTRQLFESQPSYLLGLGFGQKENGILPSEEWFYPYYQVDSTVEAGKVVSSELVQTTVQVAPVRYVNRADRPYNYPTSEAYRSYFLPQKSVWTAPYQSDRGTLLTYYSQIFDDQKRWLGTAVIDIDKAYLQAVLNEPVFRMGGELFFLAKDGSVIANPSAPDQVIDQTYADVPGLTEIWPQVKGESSSGLIEGKSGYWSYLQIPDQSWVVLAYVPYGAVFGRIAIISLGAMIAAGLLMVGATVLAVRYLNRRLRPVIDECQRLSIADESVTKRLVGKDELSQLSISFFSLLEQLQLTKKQVRLEAAHATEVEAQLKQIKRTATNQQRQQRTTQKLVETSPLGNGMQIALLDSTNPSAAEIQQELTQLNAVVSTLAEEDWLMGLLSDRRGGLLPAAELSELNQISQRLGHTFAQVLSALDQFSHLVSAFSRTYDHVLTMEQEMHAAKRDVQVQTEVVGQLQQWARGHEVFCDGLTRSSHRLGESTDISLIDISPLDVSPLDVSQIDISQTESSDRLDPVLATVRSFHQTARQMNDCLQSLFSAIANSDRKNKHYQRINTTAQVLISNASTLSISASRQQDPEVFEEIFSQFRRQGSDLEALAEQLKATQVQQWQSTAEVENISDSLRLNMTELEQVATTFSELAPQSLPSAIAAKSLCSSQQSKELSQQLKVLHSSLKELKALTTATDRHVSTALKESSQIQQLKTHVSLASS